MTFIILPLLVLSQLDPSSQPWKYGPEVIYNVDYQAHMSPHIPDSCKYISDVSADAKLKCQPRTATILNCRLESDHMMIKPSDEDKYSQVPSMFGNRMHFEIRFNRLGIKDLVVSSTISPTSLDLLRFVVNHLHVGIDLENKAEGNYEQWENYTTGNCLTSYRVRFNHSNIDHAENTLDLKSIWNPTIKTIIVKRRDINKCQQSAPYYLSSRDSWRDDPKYAVSMVSSVSQIAVDQSTFISTTQTQVASKELNNTLDITMRENVMVVFDSIVPAKGKIHKIENPASAGIITGKWLHDEYSEDNAEIQE